MVRRQENLITKITIHISSGHPYYVNQYVATLYQGVLKLFGIKVEQAFLLKKYMYITVLRSPHVDKKAQDHFEKVVYDRVVSIKIPSKNKETFLLLFGLISQLKSQTVQLTLDIKSGNI